MAITRLNFYIFIIFWIFTNPITGTANTIDTNIREQCRTRVSGLYLSTWNKLSNSKDLLKLAKQNQQDTIQAIAENEKKLEQILNSEAHKAFDYQSAEKENTTRVLIKSLKQSLVQQKKLLEQAQENYNHLKAKEKKLKIDIRKVFSIKKVGVGKHAESFKVEYLRPCPKYRFVCPLERKDAQMLLGIFEEDEIPTSCQKYTGHFEN